MRNKRSVILTARESRDRNSFHVLPLWPLALLAAAGMACTIGSATAQPLNFWTDDIFYDEPATPPPPPVMPRRQRSPQHHAFKSKAPVTPSRKPKRPLIVTISIENQSMKVYDANGLFAESPVSTGMRGHSTPLGIFSVIQKNKWHRSNIYSGAPMPYMQRLTWSGIAMHAGALPGYPASHGCIRMPTSFATQIWNWTRMGARVVIAPGDIAPVQFSHPLLVTQKPPPAPSPEIATPTAVAPSQQSSTLGIARSDTTTIAVANLSELRPSLSAQSISTQAGETTGMAKADKPTKVADASAALPSTATSTTISDSDTATAVPVPTPDDAAPAPVVRRTGPIAVMISRKDGKLYARQNFEPLFDVPITIALGDRPLGTHLFTAEADAANAGTFRWSALTMPATAGAATARHGATKHRRDVAARGLAPSPATDSPAEALDRVTIPAEAMTKIAEALTTGSSIIVSDQGLDRSETGQGTEFIVPLH